MAKIILSFVLIVALLGSVPLAAQDKNKNRTQFLVLPAVSYSPETELQLGAVGFLVIKRDSIPDSTQVNRPITINPWIIYSLRKQLEANIDVEYFFKNGDFFKVSTRYFNFPDLFYGIGPDSELADEESFTNEAIYLETNYLRMYNNEVFYGFATDIRHDVLFDLEEDGSLTEAEIKGQDGGFLAGFGPSFRFDSRDDVLYPSKGILFEFNGLYYPRLSSGKYSYGSFQFDYRQYLKIKNERNILAWQILLNLTSGRDIPFYKLPRIGGSKRLRGISHYNRFLDRQAFYTQVEYRKKLFWRIGAVVFAGMGNVAPSPGEFSFNQTEYVFGLGGRFQVFKDQGMNVRIDLGFSGGGENGLYFQVREAF